MRLILSVAVVLATLPAGVARGDDSTQIRWRFEKGPKAEYTITQNVSTSMDLGGAKTETSQNAVFGYSFEVTGHKDGIAQLDMVYNRVQMAMKVPFGDVDYDSADPQKGSAQGGPVAGLLQVFDTLIGAPFKLAIDKDGRLKDFRIPDSVAEKIKTSVPGPMAGSFGEEGMRQTVSMAFPPTPPDAVSKGDTWENVHKVKTPMGTMSYDITYTYLGPDKVGDKAVEKIGVKTVVSLEPSPEAPLKVTVKNQESKGTALFDNAAGRLHSLDEVVKLDLEVSVGGNSMVQSLQMAYKIAEGKVPAPGKEAGTQ